MTFTQTSANPLMARLHPENPARCRSGADRRHPTLSARRRQPALAAVLLSLVVLGGCASDDTTRSGLFEPYRIDLPQGNYLTRDLLDQVKPGMREEQVRRILGTPLLNNVFQPNQQHYVFSFKHPSGRVDLRQVHIEYDESGLVTAVESNALPQSESPSDPALPGFRKDAYDR